jgi:chromosome segregation ATPase
MATKTNRTTRSRAELDQGVADVASKVKASASLSPKEKESRTARSRTAKEAVAGVTVETAVQRVTEVGLTIQRSLASLNEELVAKTQELELLKEGISALHEELEGLHGKDVLATSLDTLVAEHEAKKAQLAQETAEARNLWTEEDRTHSRMVQERNAETQKARTREEDEYRYKTTQQRKNEQDQFVEALRETRASEARRVEALERQWAEREASLKTREQELVDLKAKVEAFPKELDAEVKKQTAIVANVLNKDHKHETELLRRDMESRNQLLTQQVSATEADKLRLHKQIDDLNNKLAEATQKVTEVATKALEAASGQQALAQVMSLNQSRSDTGVPSRSKA